MGPSKGGAPKGGAPKGGAPKGGGPKISRFFFPSSATIFFLLSLSWGPCVEFWWFESCSIFRSVPIMASESISYLMIGGDDLAAEMRSERVWRKFVAVFGESVYYPPSGRKICCKWNATNAICWTDFRALRTNRQHSYHDHRWSRESCSIRLSRQSRPGSGRENICWLSTVTLMLSASRNVLARSTESRGPLCGTTAESSSTLGSYRCGTELASALLGTMHCLLQRKLLTQQLKSGSAITMLPPRNGASESWALRWARGPMWKRSCSGQLRSTDISWRAPPTSAIYSRRGFCSSFAFQHAPITSSGLFIPVHQPSLRANTTLTYGDVFAVFWTSSPTVHVGRWQVFPSPWVDWGCGVHPGQLSQLTGPAGQIAWR